MQQQPPTTCRPASQIVHASRVDCLCVQTSSSEEDKFKEAGGMMPSGHGMPIQTQSLDGQVEGRARRESQRNIDPNKLTASQKAVKQGGLLLPFQPVVLTFKVRLPRRAQRAGGAARRSDVVLHRSPPSAARRPGLQHVGESRSWPGLELAWKRESPEC